MISVRGPFREEDSRGRIQALLRNDAKNNSHTAGCLALKNKSTFFPYD
jgi:hypothetical protein